MHRTRATRHAAGLILAAMVLHLGAGRLVAQQPLPVSKGVYRLPFEDGTSVTFQNDHTDHPTTLNRVDMTGAGSPTTVVAAAAGWIRLISDGNNTTCCGGTCANNFVWIEHPNGEWTKYTHMSQNSVTALGLMVGDWVNAGDPLGTEDDIGQACGVHVHFEVAVPKHVELPPPSGTDPDSPPDTVVDWFGGGWLYCDECNCGGFCGGLTCGCAVANVNRQNRIPVFCQIGFAVDNETHTAGPCDDVCNDPVTDLSGVTVSAGTPYYDQVSGTAGNPNGDFVIEANAGAAIRAGDSVTLSPGFHAELGSYFSASIGACDTPGGTGE